MSAAVLAALIVELRAWAGAEDAAESEQVGAERELGLGAPRLDGTNVEAAIARRRASGSETRRECSKLSAKRKPTA